MNTTRTPYTCDSVTEVPVQSMENGSPLEKRWGGKEIVDYRDNGRTGEKSKLFQPVCARY